MQTVVGLFKNSSEADLAIDALQDAGFTNADVSVMARDEVVRDNYADYNEDVDAVEGAGVGATGGAVVGGLTGLLMGLGAIAIPGIGPVIAAGTLATALGSAAAGAGVGAAVGAVTGGVVAALVDMGIPEEDADFYAEGVRRGGVLVTVQANDSRADVAKGIMRSYNALEVNTNRKAWQSSGWRGFDESVTSSRDYPRL